MNDVKRQVRLVTWPDGEPEPMDWAFTEESVPASGDGHVSIEPAMRGWTDDRPSRVRPLGLLNVGAAQAVQASA